MTRQQKIQEALAEYKYDLDNPASNPTYSPEEMTTQALSRLIDEEVVAERLDAQIKILAHILVHEATGKKHIGLSRTGVIANLAQLQQQKKEIPMTNPSSEQKIRRKALAGFLRHGTLTDGTTNPNTLNTLERFVDSAVTAAEVALLEKLKTKFNDAHIDVVIDAEINQRKQTQ